MYRFFLFTCLFLFIAGGAWYALTHIIFDSIHEKTLLTLRNIGIYDAELEEREAHFGFTRYQNASLDDDEFSSIHTLENNYNPLNILTGGELDSLVIDGAHLTGEISKDGALSISGWNNSAVNLALPTLPVRSLTIQNSQLSLLTYNFGGVSITYDLHVEKRDEGLVLQGHLRSQQKNLNFVAKIHGTLNSHGLWQIRLDLEQGKLDFDPLKASRVNGWLTLSFLSGEKPEILSSIQAGHLSFYDFPWQDASGTIEGSLGGLQSFFDAKSVGHEGVELSLQVQRTSSKTTASGTLYSNQPHTLLQYLESHEAPLTDRETLRILRQRDNVALNFFIEDLSSQRIEYSLSPTP